MNKVKNVLYLGWLGQGNVGDDVLYELFKIMFYKYTSLHHQNILTNIDAYPLNKNYKLNLENYDLVVLGGGSLIHLPYWLKLCKEAIKLNIPVVSWGTGADGEYKNVQTIQLKLHSYKHIYEQFSYLSVRGPMTKHALITAGVNGAIHKIGDPALIYFRETFSNVDNENAKKQILINWGTSYNNIFGQNEQYIESELVKVIHYLLDEQYAVRIYPIWVDDIPSIKRLQEKVADERCQVDLFVSDAKTLQRMIYESFFTINFKLHANILSAAANKPYVSLAYRGKCFDFSQTVHCLDYTIGTDEVTASKVIEMVDDVIENYDEIIQRLTQAKEKYHPKLIHSIKNIATLLQ